MGRQISAYGRTGSRPEDGIAEERLAIIKIRDICTIEILEGVHLEIRNRLNTRLGYRKFHKNPKSAGGAGRRDGRLRCP